jgi:hypothetical protein
MKEFSAAWFDSCSRAWLANKKRDGHSYKYKCGVENCGKRPASASQNCSAHAGLGVVLITQRMTTRSMARRPTVAVSNRPLLPHREQYQ